ncbi:MAG: formate dehydrogenase subunit alpha [Rhodospirillaceae bacterium]|jgi:formate dehydrogenase major subunit|nr:formate dehydrogenase subunit alpha [Rhodospirillaceae bacterium]MBT4773473.1 formate dehydrogenase subunit alpha [Rhodospirillaceae bacterium]MBT5359911.1 formate dehydrogenase subunit alpha [Rhodospirillaceae bacterium]MBT5769446.1 formate dehydrogenase subunit alpha [Rhodospirillaceae bacterium]MBT6310208.1 formate dehydrogenase subunit alpha [Rhodospirillaceae bacterium]
MSNTISFTLDGREVTAAPDETIWQVAAREGTEIPHLCYAPEPGYRPDGNCRACMVHIEGERVLAASCLRTPTEGMVVDTEAERARKARSMVIELLVADQPDRATAHDGDSKFWQWADRVSVESSRFPAREATPEADTSHAAMAVNLDACIHCNLCVRACREVQSNDVIGMATRGADSKIVFDFDDPMGQSTCVACGECVQACPTGALLPASMVDEAGVGVEKADETVDSVCPFCGVGCQITYHLKDGKIQKVDGRDGPANEQRLCVKGRFGLDYVHHPHRLTTPLIRKDGVGKRWDDQVDPGDPSTHFREASWDEALEAAATGLTRARDEHGGNAVAGFGSAKGSNEEAYLFQKLIRAGFHTNNVDHCTRLCHASSVAALMETIGSGAVTAPFTAAQDTDCIIVIGARPTENHPVAATYIKDAAKRGAKLILMDPRGYALTRHADHFLQFKPGTDVALLNAIMHTIVAEELTDEQYIAGYTEDYAALRASLTDFTPEAMSPVCGIDAETIKTIARTYATAERAMIFWGMGISQHVHGTDNARCLISLALMTGQVGRPGTGLHPLRGQNNVQGASDAGLIPMVYPDYQSVADPEIKAKFESLWGVEDLSPDPGLTVVEIMDAARERDIRAMYVMGENPAMSDPDQHHARQGLAALDHLVVQEIFLTETAFHADVILPASAWPEKSGTVTNTNRQVQLGRPALAAPGMAKQDWWIIQEIARRSGLDWDYEHPSDIYAELREAMHSIDGISWERLEREDAVTYPCDHEDGPGTEIMFAEGFPTPSGRGKFVPTEVLPPDELPDTAYPMVLSTGRMLEHWHTGAITRRATILDQLEPAAVASLHPREMKRLDVWPGDPIRVSTRRGTIEIAARSDRDVPEGMVFIPFCFAEAAANLLTNPQLDPVGKIPEFKFCAAKVEAAAKNAAE